MYNHIPGHGVITRKDLVVENIKYLLILNLNNHIDNK